MVIKFTISCVAHIHNIVLENHAHALESGVVYFEHGVGHSNTNKVT